MDEAEDFQKKFPEETKRRLGVLVDKFDKVKETLKVDKFRNIFIAVGQRWKCYSGGAYIMD